MIELIFEKNWFFKVIFYSIFLNGAVSYSAYKSIKVKLSKNELIYEIFYIFILSNFERHKIFCKLFIYCKCTLILLDA